MKYCKFASYEEYSHQAQEHYDKTGFVWYEAIYDPETGEVIDRTKKG